MLNKSGYRCGYGMVNANLMSSLFLLLWQRGSKSKHKHQQSGKL